ncbi:hypothetical protein GHT06_022576 [Daphnia sinensis]|uniref:Uncharacterized protein n=1 Tax=Daphnia sinensis TaxID=1820382 RepID=A0AAD5PNS5_9CRUS|nr:hypothetical protein GHT06_022576 [Daphnia sinensis]
MQKRTVTEGCWNVVNGAVENTVNWWLLEVCKRDRSVMGAGTQSKELSKPNVKASVNNQ